MTGVERSTARSGALEVPAAAEQPRRLELAEARRGVSESCTECGVCAAQCGFLARRGTPKQIADGCDPRDAARLTAAYECSLCGRCAALCPVGVDPGALCLEMRREAVERGVGPLPAHKGLLAFERKGTSRRYSLYALPPGCDTVFFPGCALAGTRSEAVLALQERLREAVPNLGVVLDCCTKPSHDLGRDRYFREMFGELRDYLVGRGVRAVLVACPSCHQVFRRYGGALQVRSVYEVLDEQPRAEAGRLAGTVTIHDPCAVRHEEGVQQAVRSLIRGTGLQVQEMPSSGTKTLCCGEGGGARFVAPELALGWGRRRHAEAGGQRVVTYCAGCASHVGRHVPTSHLADLLLEPKAALAGRARVARRPITYWKRLRLKRVLARRMAGLVTQESISRCERKGPA